MACLLNGQYPFKYGNQERRAETENPVNTSLNTHKTIKLEKVPNRPVCNCTHIDVLLFLTEQGVQIYFPGQRHCYRKINLYSTTRLRVDYPIYCLACCPPPDCITSCIQTTKITRFYGRALVSVYSIQVIACVTMNTI